MTRGVTLLIRCHDDRVCVLTGLPRRICPCASSLSPKYLLDAWVHTMHMRIQMLQFIVWLLAICSCTALLPRIRLPGAAHARCQLGRPDGRPTASGHAGECTSVCVMWQDVCGDAHDMPVHVCTPS